MKTSNLGQQCLDRKSQPEASVYITIKIKIRKLKCEQLTGFPGISSHTQSSFQTQGWHVTFTSWVGSVCHCLPHCRWSCPKLHKHSSSVLWEPQKILKTGTDFDPVTLLFGLPNTSIQNKHLRLSVPAEIHNFSGSPTVTLKHIPTGLHDTSTLKPC